MPTILKKELLRQCLRWAWGEVELLPPLLELGDVEREEPKLTLPYEGRFCKLWGEGSEEGEGVVLVVDGAAEVLAADEAVPAVMQVVNKAAVLIIVGFGVAMDEARCMVVCLLGMTKAGGGWGVYWGGVELVEICRTKGRTPWAVMVECCTEPLRAMAPVRGGMAGGGPGGGPRELRPDEPVEGVGEVATTLSVEVCDGMRGGS